MDQRNNSIKVKSEGPQFLKLCQFMTFVMVCSMTIAQKPIEKAIEAVSKKAEKRANAKVCNQIYQKQEVYAQYLRTSFATGCLWETRRVLLWIYEKDKKQTKHVNEVFEKQDSLEFNKYSDACNNGSADMVRENKIQERIASDLWEHFKCSLVDPKDMADEGNK